MNLRARFRSYVMLRHSPFVEHCCCWLWKLAFVVPALHIVLHLLNLPHPEVLSFIP